MKKLCFLFLLPLFLTAQAPKEVAEHTWQYDLEKALKLAKKKKKNLLIYFTGSDWCSPCKMLKKDFFETQKFTDVSKNYISLYIDIPRNQDLLSEKQLLHNKKVVKRYNKKGVFPLLKIINSKGVILDEYSGYAMNGDVRYHQELLEKNKQKRLSN